MSESLPEPTEIGDAMKAPIALPGWAVSLLAVFSVAGFGVGGAGLSNESQARSIATEVADTRIELHAAGKHADAASAEKVAGLGDDVETFEATLDALRENQIKICIALKVDCK